MRSKLRPFALAALASSVLCLPLAARAMDRAGLAAWLEPQLAAAAVREGFTRYEIQSITMPPEADVAGCARIEPFLAPGARLWGRVFVGLRCVEGPRWTRMTPATVAAWGPAVSVAMSLPAGATLSAQYLRLEPEVELSREAPGWARDIDGLLGRTLTRPASPGQALRLDMTRASMVIAAGDPVRVQVTGPGFSITAAGQALGAAAAGQSVRVRTDAGRMVQGVAREGRLVEVRP